MKKKKILLGLGSFAILGLATVLASCDGEKTYTVTFYNGTTEVTTQTVTGGYNAEVPTAPTKEGSKFNGWYADEALTTAFDFGSIIEGDTAVYAGWVNESAVVFKDGSTTLSTQTVLNGSNAKVPTAPTATGKRFNGWYKDAACTQAFDFGSVITTGTTVYAGWVDQYTVTFKDGGRTLSTVTVEDGNLVDIPTAPTKDNKVFAGWFTDQTYTTAYDFGSPVTSSKSVYAKWDSVYYTVSLYIDANTKWKDVQVESEEVLPTDLAPTKNYSVWDGKWYTDAACTQQFVTSTAITGATTLYAGWNVETENVTYSFDYTPLLAAYPGKTKPSSIVNSGIFYLESGMYFEDSYANQTDSSKANDPDFNTQKKVFWWTVKTGGKLSFDWKDRGSTTKFTIYRIPAVSTNSEVPTYSDDDVVYNKTTSTLTSHFEYDCAEAGTYIFVADGSIMVQQLQCSDVVEKSAPVSISVAGARNQFLVGADFESTGLSCTLNYANGSTESVSAASTATDDKTGFVVDYSEVNFNEEGTYTVNVTYTAHDSYGDYPFTTSYDINVYAVDSIEAFTFGLDSSRNTQHNQLVYAVGDTVKTDKVYVHAYGEIGESAYDEQLTNQFTTDAADVDTTTTGKKTVTATYTKDTTKTSSFDVQVVEKVFDKDTAFATVYVDASLEDKVAKKVAFNEYTYSEYTEGSSASYVFASVTEALQYLQLCEVSDDATKVLVLADGVYNEKVFVDMPNVTILGSTSLSTNNGSNSGAVITFNAMNGITAPNGASYSTDGAASFTISKKATNCLVSNVTLSNYYNTHERYVESQKITSSTQATSVLVRGDMAQFYNVSFSGYHDTLYADQGRQYYNNCYIEGRTDYIFGSDATAYFTNCTIKTLGAGLTEKNGGYVVATKGTSGLKYGYVFNNCTFTADDQTQAGCVSIARGWDVNMTIMVMNCNIDNHFSKGTYGQGYYEVEDCTAEKYEAAFATGIYTRSTTYNEFKPSFTAVASTAKFNAEETYFVKNGDAYVKEVVTADTFAAAVEAGLYTVKFDSTVTYYAKNGEEYVEQYLTKDTFIAALETGLYTATDTYTKEKQSADGEYQFDASKTYYVQFNDRYTKMNADPVASLLFEYNNNGEGAIDYDANLANRYARKTFTLLNPASTDDQAIAAKYADLNEVFAGSNYNWNPVGQGYSLTIYDDTTTIASYSKYVYVGNTLTATQVKEIKALVEANLNAETQVLVGLYTDSSFTTELSKGLEITTETKIYAKIKKAKVTVTQELFETGTLTESIADGSTVVDNNYFTVKSVKIVASVATGYAPAVTEDEKHTFAKGLLPTGGTKYSDGKYYEITAKEDGQITIYYLSTDSGYTTKNQSKNDKLVTKAGDADAVTAEQIAYDNKVAYTYTFNVTKGTVYRVSSTSNRLVLLGVEYYNRTVEFEEEAEETDVVTESYSYDYSKIDLSTATIKTDIKKTNADKYTADNWDKKVTKVYKKADDTEITTLADLQATATADNLVYDRDKAPLTTEMLNQGFLSVVGNVTFRSLYQSSFGVIEVAKESTNGLAVTFKGTGTITFGMLSNKSSNSTKFALKDSDGNYIVAASKGSKVTDDTATDNTYIITGTSGGDDALITFNITEAGTYTLVNLDAENAFRISSCEMTDTYQKAKETAKVTTSKSNSTLSFADTSEYDSTVFDISAITLQETPNDNGTDYASKKVIGEVKVNVKKGAVVYISGYYNQAAAVEYTITANGTTSEKINANSYVVATEDQTITITGSGNNYLQEIYVIYPEDGASAFSLDTKADNATFTEAAKLQYSAYTYGGMVIDAVAGKVTARTDNSWGEFNKARVVVVLQKGQTVKAKTYNGDATMTYSVLGGAATSVENAGAQAETSFTATEDYTVVVITGTADKDYLEYVVVE